MRRIPRAELELAPVPLSAQPDARLNRTLAAHDLHAQALQRAQDDLVEIARRAVTALVGEELALRPEHIRALVAAMIEDVRAAHQITVHVHPEDRKYLPTEGELAARAEARGTIAIVEDSSLLRGDCTLTSDHGDIDGRMSTKLAQLMAQLAPTRQS